MKRKIKMSFAAMEREFNLLNEKEKESSLGGTGPIIGSKAGYFDNYSNFLSNQMNILSSQKYSDESSWTTEQQQLLDTFTSLKLELFEKQDYLEESGSKLRIGDQTNFQGGNSYSTFTPLNASNEYTINIAPMIPGGGTLSNNEYYDDMAHEMTHLYKQIKRDGSQGTTLPEEYSFSEEQEAYTRQKILLLSIYGQGNYFDNPNLYQADINDAAQYSYEAWLNGGTTYPEDGTTPFEGTTLEIA